MENFAVFDQSICLVGHTHKPAVFRWQLHDVLDGDDEHDMHQSRHGGLLCSPSWVRRCSPSPRRSERLIINPGSVGQPRDNDACAAYAILDLGAMTWRYESVAHPVELTPKARCRQPVCPNG